MSGFQDLVQVRVQRMALNATMRHLRAAGTQGVEGVVLWPGTVLDRVATVEHALVPPQTALRGNEGVCVAVEGAALFTVNRWLFENRRTLVGQVHSHPGEAYHSATDDAYSIVSTLGGISIVVPDFARAEFSLADCAVYRLTGPRTWEPLDPEVATRLILIEG